MAQERPNRLVEWYLAAREWAPTVPQRAREWGETVRAEPALIWQTPAVRYSAWAAGVILALTLATLLPDWIAPPPPADARPESREADFHVMCSDAACGHHFMITRKKSFDSFPLECPKCEQRTGVHARQCWSDACAGRWIAPIDVERSLRCPVCGREVGRR